MIEEEATALGKRLAACRHFRPMPGLKDMQGRTWDDSLLWRWNPEVDVPDLRQPATMGILLALVREAWGDPHASSRWMKPDWKVLVQRRGYINYTVVGVGRTEAEALVAALEASPTA